MSEKGPEKISTEDRRNQIVDMLTKKGRVRVNVLSKLFDTSEVTIRNDLSGLEKMGLLERVHGGAISSYRAYYNMSIQERIKTNEEEKRKIAIGASGLISDGDTLLVNSGTTTLFTVQELRSVKNLTVVTNSILIAQEAGHYRNIHVILLGGNIDHRNQFTYGDDTINQLSRYRADKLVLSVDGISMGNGITTFSHLETEVCRQMSERVNKIIVVADYTKIGRTSFSYIKPVDGLDILVTDKKADRDELNKISKRNIEIKLV
ncbi:MAG: DeoR/GlpR transcriptional regulator [Actinobacteria bacterium]|nr:DeoR/GlpR transcriptional regulator [Actinomycetota bacterium]